MAYIGNTAENFETIEDRKTYTADGTTSKFGVLFSESNVSVFQNGVKLKETTEYSVDTAGTYITITTAPSSGDIIDLVGFNAITSLARNSHTREKFTVSGTATSSFTLTTNTAVEDNVVVYVNGARLHTDDYSFYTANDTIVFTSSRPVGDIVDVDIVTAGFRTSNHPAKSEVGTHLSFENNKILDNDVTVADTYNMLMVGPLTANATITVSTDASLTII